MAAAVSMKSVLFIGNWSGIPFQKCDAIHCWQSWCGSHHEKRIKWRQCCLIVCVFDVHRKVFRLSIYYILYFCCPNIQHTGVQEYTENIMVYGRALVGERGQINVQHFAYISIHNASLHVYISKFNRCQPIQFCDYIAVLGSFQTMPFSHCVISHFSEIVAILYNSIALRSKPSHFCPAPPSYTFVQLDSIEESVNRTMKKPPIIYLDEIVCFFCLSFHFRSFTTSISFHFIFMRVHYGFLWPFSHLFFCHPLWSIVGIVSHFIWWCSCQIDSFSIDALTVVHAKSNSEMEREREMESAHNSEFGRRKNITFFRFLLKIPFFVIRHSFSL